MGKKLFSIKGEDNKLFFECPGCDNDLGHFIIFKGDKSKHPIWEFDGNMESPTISPSIKVTRGNKQICHFFIKQGKIQFLNDCFHKLAGKTVDMKDVE